VVGLPVEQGRRIVSLPLRTKTEIGCYIVLLEPKLYLRGRYSREERTLMGRYVGRSCTCHDPKALIAWARHVV
jgi:hypothetical protein